MGEELSKDDKWQLGEAEIAIVILVSRGEWNKEKKVATGGGVKH
jgi:hypothetical protein